MTPFEIIGFFVLTMSLALLVGISNDAVILCLVLTFLLTVIAVLNEIRHAQRKAQFDEEKEKDENADVKQN